MKRVEMMLAVLMVLVLACAHPSFSQTNTVELRVATSTSVTGTVKIEIPFAFSLAGKSFAAGTYSVGPANDRAVMIKSEDGRSVLVVATNSIEAAEEIAKPKLVFHRYGDDYFLAQSWLRHSSTGREFFASADEIHAARGYQQQVVALVAK